MRMIIRDKGSHLPPQFQFGGGTISFGFPQGSSKFSAGLQHASPACQPCGNGGGRKPHNVVLEKRLDWADQWPICPFHKEKWEMLFAAPHPNWEAPPFFCEQKAPFPTPKGGSSASGPLGTGWLQCTL